LVAKALRQKMMFESSHAKPSGSAGPSADAAAQSQNSDSPAPSAQSPQTSTEE
ncbi:MaoC family dehydratase, partial [Burkholderia multivorans]